MYVKGFVVISTFTFYFFPKGLYSSIQRAKYKFSEFLNGCIFGRLVELAAQEFKEFAILLIPLHSVFHWLIIDHNLGFVKQADYL